MPACPHMSSVRRMPSCAICVRTWRRTATSTRFATVCRPVVGSRYVTVDTPSRIMRRTAWWTARSAVSAPVLTFVTASATHRCHRSSAPCAMSTLSRSRMAAMPRAVSSTCRGSVCAAAGAPAAIPMAAASAASLREMASSTVTRTASFTSARWLSMNAMRRGAADCARRFRAVVPRCPSSAMSWSSRRRHRYASMSASISPYTEATMSPAWSR